MLIKKINEDFKESMKNKDAIRTSTISFLRSELINLSINQKKKVEEIEDKDVIAVLRKLAKQRNDSIEQFKKGNRQELADKETKELEILKSYLPQEMPEEELSKIIEEVVSLVGASTMKDMGKVMKELVPKVAGRADNSMISKLVKEKLS